MFQLQIITISNSTLRLIPQGHANQVKKMSPLYVLLLFFIPTDGQINTTINPKVKRSTPYNASAEDDITFDDPQRPTLAYPAHLSVLFIFTTLLIGVLIRSLMLWTSRCLPYRVVMFCIGGLAGFCSYHYPEFKPFVQTCYVDVDLLLFIFLPIIEFHTAYSVDAHSFVKSLPQVLLVSVPGTLLTSVMVAFMGYYLIESSWNFGTALLFGVVCSPVYPMEVVKQLKEISKGKYLAVLLMGEGVIGDASVMVTFTAVFGYLALSLTEASQVSLMILRFAGGGILLGVVMGNITAGLLSLTYNDMLCAVMVTLSGAYLTYYIGEKFLYVSGLLGTVITGVLVSNQKSTIAGDIEAVVSHFWYIITHVANTLLFTMVGVVIFEKISFMLTAKQVRTLLIKSGSYRCTKITDQSRILLDM